MNVNRGAVSKSLLLGLSDAGDGAGTWTIEVKPQGQPSGVQIVVPGAVTIAPGGGAQIPVTANAAANAAAGEANPIPVQLDVRGGMIADLDGQQLRAFLAGRLSTITIPMPPAAFTRALLSANVQVPRETSAMASFSEPPGSGLGPPSRFPGGPQRSRGTG